MSKFPRRARARVVCLMNGINRSNQSCSVEPYESNEKVGRANGLSDDQNLQSNSQIQLINNNILTHRRAVPQPPCSSRLLLPRRGAIAMDPLLKRGKMRAFNATNVSEASGSLSRRCVPEVSGSRRNPSASEVSVPIPKWRSNVSQSSRPKNATLKPLESSRPQGRNSIARKTNASRRRVKMQHGVEPFV